MLCHHSNTALVLSLIISSFVTIQPASAEALIKSCNHCHDGVKQDIPVIDGISAYALESSMLAYLDNSRVARPYEGADMKTILTSLSDADFKKLTEHYSSQTFTPIQQTFDAKLAETGKTIHESYCSRCHTEGGSLAEDDSSILAGQWKNYLIAEMKNYRNGTRIGDKKMIDAIKSLSDEHIQALAEYYASQQ